MQALDPLDKKNQKCVVIVQARMRSTRLPDKVMRKLAGITVLEHVLRRCQAIRGIDEVICATTDTAETDLIAAEAARIGVTVFRGSEPDVLDRYYRAASAARAGIVMRVTSDCPLIDPGICSALLSLFLRSGVDYACNNMPRSWPHGMDAEVFSMAALTRAAEEATEPFAREHVTPWLRAHPEVRRTVLHGPGWPHTEHRLTLDHPEDLRLFEHIADKFPLPLHTATLDDILRVLAAHPEIDAINRYLGRPEKPSSEDKRPVVLFRFDAGPEIGGGHAMRCATLEAAFRAAGWRALRLVSQETADHLHLESEDPTVVILDADDGAGEADAVAAQGICGDLLVVDHYGRDRSFETPARRFAKKILVIDDLADRIHDCDWLLDATPGRTVEDYQGKVPQTAALLLGPKYALIRRQFRQFRVPAAEKRAATSTNTPTRILISCGLIDSANATELALAALAQAKLDADVDVVLGPNAAHLKAIERRAQQADDRISLHVDSAHISALMTNADLCIGAGGTTTWERCCVGLPSLVIGVADNQRPNAAALGKAAVAEVAGWIGALSEQALSETITRLWNDRARRQEMAEKGMTLVDGRGAERVVLATLAPASHDEGATIRLRPAEQEDCATILEWQRAPETRRFARNPGIPTKAEHDYWYSVKLTQSDCWFTIIEVSGEAAGFLRFDQRGTGPDGDIFEISIAVAPAFHRRGIARAALQLAQQFMKGNILTAQVLSGNEPSAALFRTAGFAETTRGWYRAARS